MELYQLKRYNTIMKRIMYLVFLALLFIGCSYSPRLELKPISYGDYKEVHFTEIEAWEQEDFTKALDVFIKTCSRTSSKKLFRSSCEKSNEISLDDRSQAKKFFEKNFTPFVSLSEKSLATGYFEPLIEGSFEKSARYPYPLYGVPTDLVRVELPKSYKERLRHPLRGRFVNGAIHPYFTRQEINTNGLAAQEPICYVRDKVDLFFLQVQGSGCIRLDNNSIIYVGYADQNGFPYVSIGKEMIKKGMLTKEEISLESIRSYLYANPHQTDMVLNSNPSYIFFQIKTHSASGALGLILEPKRSVAVDKRNIPLGMPLFISTTDPLSNEKFERIVFAHDTGGAIKGEARIDIFYGAGEIAREKAGNMKNNVKLWMLVPNDYLAKSK